MKDLQKFINKYNKDYRTKFNNTYCDIRLRFDENRATIVDKNNKLLAWASSVHDLKIMLFLIEDDRQDEDPWYWIYHQDYGYNPVFLNDLFKYE